MEIRSVLIIDDEKEDLVLVRRHLEKDPLFKYQFEEAHSVQSGLEKLRGKFFDCIILDHRLADGNGFDFLKAVRTEPHGSNVPIVIATGNGDQATAIELIKAGAHDYVVKSGSESDGIRLAVNNVIFRMKSQSQLEEQRKELERLYEEAKATNAELTIAKELAERANTAKDEFLALLSHELRTPLTPVLSIVSSTLGEGTLSPDLKETFSIIRRNIQLEARLIDDLLDLTHVLKGTLEVQKQPIDLHACVQAAIDLGQADFDDKRIVIHSELHASPSMVSGDFARLQQVIWNLLNNSSQTMRNAGRIEIKTQHDNDSLMMEIRNTGGGAIAERIENIFEAFRQPMDGQVGGVLGLGLSIARSLVLAHDGDLSAKKEGAAVVFTIRLPALKPSAQNPAEKDGADAKSFRGKLILVVEDHEDTRRVLSRALRRRGYGVTAAASVEAACEQFAAVPADLVICDIGLPDGTGWDVIRRLKEIGPVKAIAVSGYGMDHDLQKSRDAGFIAHITKPVDFPRLEAAISKVFEGDTPPVPPKDARLHTVTR